MSIRRPPAMRGRYRLWFWGRLQGRSYQDMAREWGVSLVTVRRGARLYVEHVLQLPAELRRTELRAALELIEVTP